MRAVIYDEPGSMHIGEAEKPSPGEGQALIEVARVGICGSDLNIAAGLFPPTPFPITPGHEFSGVVAEVGTGVDFLSPGTRVAVDPSLFCGHCQWCYVGRGNLCDSWGAIGDTVDGAAAEFVVVPARNCHPIPDAMSFAEAAAVEPLSCAVHAIDRVPPRVGESVLVIGGGTMGLLTGQLLARGGAADLVLVERSADRRPLGEQMGFHASYDDVGAALERRPAGFDLVVDATGVPAAIQSGLEAVAKGGRFLQVGVAPPESRIELSPFQLYNQEITLHGSMAVLDSYAPALKLIADGVVDVNPILTHVYPLAEYMEAFEALGRGEGLKIQISPGASL